MTKTITVTTAFGNDKELTKVEFSKEWADHIKQLRMLSWETEWQQEVDGIIAKVQAEAEAQFDRLYEEQTARRRARA